MEALQPYMTMIYIAGSILLLLLVLLVLIRLLGRTVRGRKGSRLGISEYYEIDKSRRLVLVRRDDMEHLILIGGNEDIVVESGIGGSVVTATPVQPVRPAPRPAVFGGRRPTLRPVEPGTLRPMRDDPDN